MNKSDILKEVIRSMEDDLHRLQAANERASVGATNVAVKAETKWDTCGLEASYLARGHAQQFQTLAAEVHQLRSYSSPNYKDKPIGVGALVNVDMGDEPVCFFLLHFGGGIDVTIDGIEVTVITPESPVGAALMDKKQDEEFSFRAGSTYKVLRVE